MVYETRDTNSDKRIRKSHIPVNFPGVESATL